ncbi:MAG: D-cysteine desulfhydrase family protein, partial [Bacteroidota bacterium]
SKIPSFLASVCMLEISSEYLGLGKRFSNTNCQLNRDYDASGYGQLTSEEISSIQTLAKNEGILLDPVYTGRAFNGLLDMMDQNTFEKKSNILFWHTGGYPAIFAHSSALLA